MTAAQKAKEGILDLIEGSKSQILIVVGIVAFAVVQDRRVGRLEAEVAGLHSEMSYHNKDQQADIAALTAKVDQMLFAFGSSRMSGGAPDRTRNPLTNNPAPSAP